MKQLLEYIVPNIVNHPEDVVITEDQNSEGTTLTIEVNPEDMGRVIGKSGKVIKAIRQIARIMAIKRGVRVNIDILDKNTGDVASENNEQPVTDETPAEDTAPVETETQDVATEE